MLNSVAAAMVAGVRAVAAALPVLLRDLVGLAAVASIAYGAWLIYPPAGFIVGGVLLLAGVIMSVIASGAART